MVPRALPGSCTLRSSNQKFWPMPMRLGFTISWSASAAGPSGSTLSAVPMAQHTEAQAINESGPKGSRGLPLTASRLRSPSSWAHRGAFELLRPRFPPPTEVFGADIKPSEERLEVSEHQLVAEDPPPDHHAVREGQALLLAHRCRRRLRHVEARGISCARPRKRPTERVRKTASNGLR